MNKPRKCPNSPPGFCYSPAHKRKPGKIDPALPYEFISPKLPKNIVYLLNIGNFGPRNQQK